MAVRILLVDDAREMRDLVAASLTLDGRFEVVGQAGNGREAIALTRETMPDVVLLDLSMPEMDGLEALPHILATAPGTVVVVFSGFDEVQIGVEARALGAADYVAKGVPLDALADRVHAVFRRRRP